MAVYTDPVHVSAVQAAVNAAGYQPPLVVDGKPGPMTTAGVKWFQAQHGLTVDGLIGDQTMAATIAPTLNQVVAGTSAALVPAIASISPAPGSPNFVGPTLAQAGKVAAPLAAAVAAAKPLPSLPGLPSVTKLPPPPSSSGIPTWVPPVGLAVLGATGAAFAPFLPFVMPLKIAIGGAVGGLLGAGVSLLLPKPAGSAIHGEASFGWEHMAKRAAAHHAAATAIDPYANFELDSLYMEMLDDDGPATAGGIGLEAASGLRG